LGSIRQQYGSYLVNGSSVENDLMWELKNIGKDNFYAFYTESDARFKKIRVDQYMDIGLYDLWFGTLYTDNYSYQASKTISTTVPGQKDPVKETVTATVNVTRRLIDSRAMMDCRITDTENRNIIFNQRFPARYTWENLSGEYTGDSRALSSQDRQIVNGRYSQPPSYDELYKELVKKVIYDFSYKMRELYGK